MPPFSFFRYVMEYKKFGNTNLTVSTIGLGCSRLGGNLQGGSRQEAQTLLQEALEQGINFYDTADSYGQGQSEKLLGKAFKRQRDRVIFASKAGYHLSSLATFAAKFKPILKPLVRSLRPQTAALGQAKSSVLRQNFARDYLQQAVEGSLRRLNTDYLDLFQLHSPPKEILQTEEVWQTLENLQAQGKVRYYGVSCDTVEDALICLQQPKLSSIQLEINLLEQEAITRVLPLAMQKQVAVIGRQPFASGRLLTVENSLGASLQQGRNFLQTALQFVLQQDGISVVLAGVSSCQHLKTNLDALKATPLSLEELKNITKNQIK